MERVKRRRLKFPCLFGGNEATPKGRTIQSWCPGYAITDHSLFKFEVGKSTCKRSNHHKKRSSSLLSKLMGKDVISSINKKQRIKSKRKKVSKSDINSNTTDAYDVDHFDDYKENTEVTTVPSRITFGLNDRLTHSLSNLSEPSLISEAKNKISEKWEMTKTCSTSILPSFQDSNHGMSVYHENEKIMVYSEPLNRREGLKGIINHRKDIALKKERSSKRLQLFQHGTHVGIDIPESQSNQKSTETYFENNGATYEASSVDSVAGYNLKKDPLIGKLGGKSTALQHSGPETEYSESSKKVNHGIQVSPVEAPLTEDVLFHSHGFQRLNDQLQGLKKQLHLLKIESLYSSNRPTPTQKRIQHGQQPSVESTWESSFFSHILQVSDIYETDPDTIHHPRDPRLFYRIEKYYFEGAKLSKSEKHLLYDYIEQTFIKISKSMAGGLKDQVKLSNLSIEDQVVKVVEEIKKEDAEIFHLNNYDKDPEWLEHNQIINLGKLLSELVLNDLVLEVISC